MVFLFENHAPIKYIIYPVQIFAKMMGYLIESNFDMSAIFLKEPLLILKLVFKIPVVTQIVENNPRL